MTMHTWLEDIETALANLGGVGRLSQIYDEVRRIREGPHPRAFRGTIRGTIETHSSDSAKFRGRDIFFSVHGLGAGVWGLRSYLKNSPVAADLGGEEDGTEAPERVRQETYRVLRDTALARQIKMLNQHRCQLCGERIRLTNGDYYAEAHHIQPLGRPHNGPDVASNILVLCPTHHVMLDYGVIELNGEDIGRWTGHKPGQCYIRYHNERIFQKVRGA